MDGKKGGKEADGPTSMRMRPKMDAMEGEESARGVGACSGVAWSVPGFRIEFSGDGEGGSSGMDAGRETGAVGRRT